MRIGQSRSDPRGRLGLLGVGCAALVLGMAAAQEGSGGINRREHLDKPHVVLVSLDGFRADYLDRFRLPHLQRIMHRGTRARWMVPVFPTLTFPNHYSLVTGLYPEHHGIVANSFYDPARREKYSMSDAVTVIDGSWYRGEPIWVTAERQGMVAACFFWPGSEAAIGGVRPTFWNKYDGRVPNEQRVTTVIDWLRLPAEERPHLITLYFSEVDTVTHNGPLDAPAVERAAASVDRAIGQLLDGIDALPIRNRTYLVITSDHGMAEVATERAIAIESLVDLDGVIHTFDGAVTSLHVRDADLTRATRLRDDLNARLEHGRAYLRRELPERFHYRDEPRAGDVIVIMDEGWTLRRAGSTRAGGSPRWATHGWDAELPSMRAVFLALGPGIPAGSTMTEVRNIDVYPWLTEILGLRAAAPVDGRPGLLREILTTR